MGRTITPKYRIETRTVSLADHTARRGSYAWSVKDAGAPTEANIRAHVNLTDASTLTGGCNEHLGVEVTTSARVIRQVDDRVMAEYTRPAFEVVS